MAEQVVDKAKETSGKKRHRSPNYPAVGLRDAVDRVQKLYNADGPAGAPIESAVTHIGFSSTHGTAMTVVSALKKFGLVADKDGRLVPSKRAVDIIQFPDPHERRKKALVDAALEPTIYGDLVKKYAKHGQLPSDESLRPELVADKGFNPKAVDGFLKDFRGTLEFAGLLNGNALKLTPDRLSEWADGNESGQESDGGGESMDGNDVMASDPFAKIFGTFSGKRNQPPGQELNAKAATMEPKREIFELDGDDGQVVVQWPRKMSKTSFEYIQAWLAILEKKIKSSVTKSDE